MTANLAIPLPGSEPPQAERRFRLTTDQRLVLCYLAGLPEGHCSAFAALARRTAREIVVVRLACRRLKRIGLAEFHIGLWTLEGEPAGSGYCASKEGRAYVGDAAVIEEYWD